ncbi:MAG: PilZ domain-containing protein [Acidobacteria bacterium]|nr:PilZ domain-containing protein [Acidobacteriota bacterium]
MNADRFSLKARRTTRIPLRIPVLVVIEEAAKTRTLDGWTMIVNVHGAKIECKHRFGMHEEVTIQVPFNGMSQKGKVVWSKSEPNESGNYEFGVELDQGGNLWGVGFPPSDWESKRGSAAVNAISAVLELAPADASLPSLTGNETDRQPEETASSGGGTESVPEENYSSAPGQLGQLLDLSVEISSLSQEENAASQQECAADLFPAPMPPPEEDTPMSSTEISLGTLVSQIVANKVPYREQANPAQAASAATGILTPGPPSVPASFDTVNPTDRLSAFFNELVDAALEAKLVRLVEGVGQRMEARVAQLETSAFARLDEQAQNTSKCQLQSMERRMLEFVAGQQRALEQNVQSYLADAEGTARQRQQEFIDQSSQALHDSMAGLLQANTQRLDQHASELVTTTQLGLRASMEQQLPAIEKDLLERCRIQSERMMAAQVEQWTLLFSDRVQTAERSLKEQLDGTMEEVVTRHSAALESRFEDSHTRASQRLEQQLNRIGTQVRQAFLRHIVTELGRGQQVWIQQAQRQLEKLASENLERTRQNLSQYMKSYGESVIRQASTEAETPAQSSLAFESQPAAPAPELLAEISSEPQC